MGDLSLERLVEWVGLSRRPADRAGIAILFCVVERGYQTAVQEVTRGCTFQFGPAKSVNACSRCFTCIFDLGKRKHQTGQ